MAKKTQLSRGVSDTMPQLQHGQGDIRDMPSQNMTQRQHRLWYQSSYDRGLEWVLKMWPDIKRQYPDATLDVAYGWNTFLAMLSNNPERMSWRDKIISLLDQPGITEHGRLSKRELSGLRKQMGVWVYPTHFTEINCIGALECQQDGCVPCVMDYCALKETVGAGARVSGDIYDKETQRLYLDTLLELMGDEKLWKTEQARGIEFAKDYDWAIIADKWNTVMLEPQYQPIVTIYTPTIRTGWEEMMVKEIAGQTYGGKMEWIIVDDSKDDVVKNKMAEMAKKYPTLDIRYLRGSHEGYKYGLSHANNIGWKYATGELFVVLQDFMMIEATCIEDMVNLYRKNTDCLIATVDVGLDKEGVQVYRNVRISNEGLRYTNNPFDFEMNCGAIPMYIIKELDGWYELLDDGLGYDNTEIAYRALQKGYKIIIDETNVVTGLYHEPREDMPEQHTRYVHVINNLPVVRNEKLDKKLII